MYIASASTELFQPSLQQGSRLLDQSNHSEMLPAQRDFSQSSWLSFCPRLLPHFISGGWSHPAPPAEWLSIKKINMIKFRRYKPVNSLFLWFLLPTCHLYRTAAPLPLARSACVWSVRLNLNEGRKRFKSKQSNDSLKVFAVKLWNMALQMSKGFFKLHTSVL